MKKIKNLGLGLFAFLVAGLAFAPSTASAQVDTRRGDWRDRNRDWDRDRDRNRGRGRYDRDNRYGSIESIARRTERESNAFRAWYERNYSRHRLSRSQDNRWLKREIQGLDEAMERVRRRASDNNPNRGRSDFEDAMNHARRIDRELIFDRDRDARATIPEWIDFRVSLDALARAYGVRRF